MEKPFLEEKVEWKRKIPYQNGNKSLLELLKPVLQELTVKSDTSGYLLVVVDGPETFYADYIRSVKYVWKEIESNNTLVVLSGYCPRSEGKDVNSKYLPKKQLLPLYSAGERLGM